MTEKRAFEIAQKLYDWMDQLKSPLGQWVTDKHCFLPANVCCDVVGKAKFLKGMAEVIREA